MIFLIAMLLGPISKFDGEAPNIDTVSPRAMFEIERCLLDMDGQPIPYVYRQPDRPDEVRLIWTYPNGITGGRADLARHGEGTRVRIWLRARQARACVTPAP